MYGWIGNYRVESADVLTTASKVILFSQSLDYQRAVSFKSINCLLAVSYFSNESIFNSKCISDNIPRILSPGISVY